VFTSLCLDKGPTYRPSASPARETPYNQITPLTKSSLDCKKVFTSLCLDKGPTYRPSASPARETPYNQTTPLTKSSLDCKKVFTSLCLDKGPTYRPSASPAHEPTSLHSRKAGPVGRVDPNSREACQEVSTISRSKFEVHQTPPTRSIPAPSCRY